MQLLDESYMLQLLLITWPWLLNTFPLPHWFCLSETGNEGQNGNYMTAGCCSHLNCELVVKCPSHNCMTMGTLQQLQLWETVPLFSTIVTWNKLGRIKAKAFWFKKKNCFLKKYLPAVYNKSDSLYHLVIFTVMPIYT